MRFITRLLILCCFLCLANAGFSQFKKDSTCTGTLIGVVRDSVHNYVMQSATLSVYRVADSALVSYQLSNNYGEFSFKELPTGIPLRIVASYVGYKYAIKHFIISAKENNLDLKSLNMDRREEGAGSGLEDVIVKSLPPVQMNGDTLEFNADAFKMDPNAVAEDLLRKLPGVVVWGDGSITVNGKEVSQVLVNGKPFFGGDTRVATQNLPKQAVEKIQVYQQRKSVDNPLDSTTQINIKLKKGKETGRFGKVAAGLGTDKHYEADANINFYNNNTQLGLVGAINDINKVANSVNALMRNSTFKGVGASIDYQPDFSLQGINRPRAAGFTFQHDFIDHPDYFQQNRLSSDFFIHNNTQKLNRESQTITSLGADSLQILQSASQNQQSLTGQTFTTKYNKHKDDYTYDFSAGFTTNVNDGSNASHSDVSNSANGAQSINDAENDTHSKGNNVSLDAHITHANRYNVNANTKDNLDIRYSFNADNNQTDRLNRTTFISLANPAQNQYVDRRYKDDNHGTQQQLYLSYGSFSKWILPRGMRSINTKLINNLSFSTHKQQRQVQDKDTVSGNYQTNGYLSGTSNYTGIDERPALEFSKVLSKSLANRYSKRLMLTMNAQEQFFYRKNNSVHDFQDITQNYHKFIPSASINYQNDQYGAFNDNYTLRFATGASFPTIDQLAPLVDSSNLYYILQGNLSLKPTYKKEISFNFQHNSNEAKNPFNYNLNVAAGRIQNTFADSSITDTLGRSMHYTINSDGYQYLNTDIALNKAFKLVNHQFQVRYNGGINLSRNPSYINSVFNFSKSLSSNHALTLYYNLRDALAVDMLESYGFYQSQQTGANDYRFKNTTASTRFSASVKVTKKLTIGSNITYNHTTSSGADATNFTIWNAQAYYRFFKGNSLELKFAALDLLHQNTSIINYGNNNVITHGTVNVLQNYYMVTLSFFPRKFGKKK